MVPASQPSRSLRLAQLGLLFVVCLLTSGCLVVGEVTPTTSELPRWACPTPTPLPPIEVPAGTQPDPQGTPVPITRTTEPYEREPYNTIGQQPILRPTPHTKTGTQFFLGQLINLTRDLDVQVDITPSGTPIDGEQLSLVRLTWHNRGASVAFEPGRQVVVNTIRRADRRLVAGPWRWSADAAAAAGMATDDSVLHTEIPAGTSDLQIPILAPAGTVETLDLQLDPPNATTGTAGTLRVQFTPDRDPHCDAPGTEAAVYDDTNREVSGAPVPPGADSLVAAAMAQLGRQYCWGGKGYIPCSGWTLKEGQVTPPCASYPCWDCSGLTWGVYQAVGITIGHGTQNQKNYPQVALAQVQPGDLFLFYGINQQGRASRITHVGMYVGDVDGDGTGDMVHAANYPAGVIVTKNIVRNAYYMQRLAVVTRPPRG